MARGPKPTVRYWKSRKAYACWIGETRHFLARGPDDAPSGPTYLEALDRFRKLVAQDDGKGTDDYLVSALLNQYRAHLKATRKSGAPGVFESMARGFAVKFGKKRVCDLKPYDFDEWIKSQSQWNSTSKAHAVALILAAVSWARKKSLIQTDPLAGRVERPQPVLRGREAAMSNELMDLLIAEARKNKMKSQEFADMLWLLRETGARPIELRMAEVSNYDNGRIVFRWNATTGYRGKTADKTQRDRIIFLTPKARAYVEGLIAKHKTGRIFRTPRGANWSPTSLHNKWENLLSRPAVSAYLENHGITRRQMRIYNTRHTAISRWIEDAGDIYIASQLFGTSVKVLEKRYGHPNVDKLHERYMAVMAAQEKAAASAKGL